MREVSVYEERQRKEERGKEEKEEEEVKLWRKV